MMFNSSFLDIKQHFDIYIKLGLTVSFYLLTTSFARAQIKNDSTLSTQVTTSDNQNFVINGGEQAGNNLFHSFEQFSVPTNGEAFFNNGSDIANIISRVTGGSVSNIDGSIGANGSANLLLINPAGIIFGNNARLNIGGSFLASTANSILFPNGIEFSAGDTQTSPLLTINMPIGLGLLDNPATIVHRSRVDNLGLEVVSGNNFTLVGGEIDLRGGIITAPGGRVELGGLSAAGDIGINTDGSLTFPEGVAKADISLSEQALVKVRAGGEGFINVNAQNVSLSDESILLGGIESNLGSPQARAGDININAISIVAEENSQITTATDGIGDAGNIFISTTTLEFTDRSPGDDLASRLIASTFGQGNAGNITINANSISFDGSGGGAVSNVGIKANDDPVANVKGNAGNITINTNSIFLSNGAGLTANTGGIGNGGSVKISARDIVSLDGRGDAIPRFNNVLRATALKSEVRGENAIGNGGTVEVNTNVLSITNEAEILTPTTGQGSAGDIRINARDSINLNNRSQIISQVIPEGMGDAGNIEINTATLSLSDRSRILSDTQQLGNSGSVLINATDSVFLDGTSEIVTGSGVLGEQVSGNAGNLEINTGTLSLENASFLLAQTNGEGNAGNIIIQTTEEITLDSSSKILSQVQEEGRGNGGNININTPSLLLTDFSLLSTSTLADGRGNAGNITVNANDIQITDSASIDAFTENDSAGGNINLNAQTLELFNGGKIVTLTQGNGDAGNISLNISDRLTLTGNDLIFPERLVQAETERFAPSPDTLNSLGAASGLFASTSDNSAGDSGNIQVFTPTQVNVSDSATVSVASQGQGSAGTLSIQTNSLNLDNGSLLASTPSGQRGNISLTINDSLLLSSNSLISARAIDNANGGNIDIKANSIIAFPNQNNDIIASAQQGTGGNININAEAIFGLVERSSEPANNLNDIDASSMFGLDGTVAIRIPQSDLTESLSNLPTEVINVEKVLQTSFCRTSNHSQYNITGRGGIPLAPSDRLLSEHTWSDWRIISSDSTERKPSSPSKKILNTSTSQSTKSAIFTAQGWIINERGKVVLTALPLTVTPQSPDWTSFGC